MLHADLSPEHVILDPDGAVDCRHHRLRRHGRSATRTTRYTGSTPSYGDEFLRSYLAHQSARLPPSDLMAQAPVLLSRQYGLRRPDRHPPQRPRHPGDCPGRAQGAVPAVVAPVAVVYPLSLWERVRVRAPFALSLVEGRRSFLRRQGPRRIPPPASAAAQRRKLRVQGVPCCHPPLSPHPLASPTITPCPPTARARPPSSSPRPLSPVPGRCSAPPSSDLTPLSGGCPAVVSRGIRLVPATRGSNPRLRNNPQPATPSRWPDEKTTPKLRPIPSRINRESTSNLFRPSAPRPQAREGREKTRETERIDSNPTAVGHPRRCRGPRHLGYPGLVRSVCAL